MFSINEDQSIYLTRGDSVSLEISATMSDTGMYMFKPGDVIRFQIFEKGRCDNVVLSKDVTVNAETSIVNVPLHSSETRLGELIHKPKDYWYEVELNPDTEPQTIIGYDTSGPKVFRLFPEGGA